MPIDGLMLSSIRHELDIVLKDAKIEKIAQPEKDELVLQLHVSNNVENVFETRNPKLLLSANPSHPRIHLSTKNKENPIVALNFCMLLRKHLSNAKILSITQPGLERVLEINLEAKNEMYEIVSKKLIIEIMGRYSNIIFTDENYLIYDAIRQVDFTTSSKRQLLPGLYYELPPAQDKEVITGEISKLDFDFKSEKRLDKVLLEKYMGFSSLICREIAYIISENTDIRMYELDEKKQEKLIFILKEVYRKWQNAEFEPHLLLKEEPFDFYCFNINQYGFSTVTKKLKTSSELLDTFFAEKDRVEHIKRHSSDIMKILTNAATRVSRKIAAQTQDLEDCKKADKYKDYGDLIFANIYNITSGKSKVKLINYCSEEQEEVEIPLNPSLTPVKNAQRYYKLYKKAQTAKEILRREIPLAKKEEEYINRVFDNLVFCENLNDLSQIREELAREKYITKLNKKTEKNKKSQNPKPAEFISTEGVKILVGKNNIQNDFLTFKLADKRDIWFHVKNYPACHTVLFTSEKECTDISYNEAAAIAASFSKASKGQKVDVDYTEVKNVKKPSGSKPGYVVYDNYKTAYIAPDTALAEKLRSN